MFITLAMLTGRIFGPESSIHKSNKYEAVVKWPVFSGSTDGSVADCC